MCVCVVGHRVKRDTGWEGFDCLDVISSEYNEAFRVSGTGRLLAETVCISYTRFANIQYTLQ